MLLHCNEMGVGRYRGGVTSGGKCVLNEINNLAMDWFRCYRDFIAWLHRNGAWRERESKKVPINYTDHETMKTRGYMYSLFLTV